MKNTNYKHILTKAILSIYLCLYISCQPQSRDAQITESESFRFLEQDIAQIQKGYKDGSYTIKEVVQAYLDRIDEIDNSGPKLNSIIFYFLESLFFCELLFLLRLAKNSCFFRFFSFSSSFFSQVFMGLSV